MSAFGMAGRRETPTGGHGIRRLPPASRAGNLSGLATCNAERSSTRTGFAGIANLPVLYFALLWKSARSVTPAPRWRWPAAGWQPCPNLAVPPAGGFAAGSPAPAPGLPVSWGRWIARRGIGTCACPARSGLGRASRRGGTLVQFRRSGTPDGVFFGQHSSPMNSHSRPFSSSQAPVMSGSMVQSSKSTLPPFGK